MKRVEDFERNNARLWETESQITVDDNDAPTEVAINLTQSRPETNRSSGNLALRGSAAIPNVRTVNNENQKQRIRRAGETQKSQSQQFRTQNGAPRGTHRQSRVSKQPRIEWAEPPSLETTRIAAQSKIHTQEEQKKTRYTKGNPENVEIVVQGHYLWPEKAKPPTKMFGDGLEDLYPINIQYRVFIKWDDSTNALVVKSPRVSDSETNVIEALKAIRHSYKSAKARAISGEPYYTVIPPTAGAMTSVLQPIVREGGVTMIELCGNKLHGEEKQKWKLYRRETMNADFEAFEMLLRTRILALAPHKGWMRLRVHFGHHNLPLYPDDFKSGGSFQRFKEILDMPRAQAKAKFDKKLLNLEAAMFMRDKILRESKIDRYIPPNGKVDKLEDVEFKDTLCLFFQDSQHVPIRVEADIDRILTDDYEYHARYGNNHSNSIEFKMGTTRYFWDNRRNKHLEMVSIDIEKQVDWSLELITDNKIQEPEPKWMELIQGCVNPRTKTRKDKLGLEYADVALRAPSDVKIDSIVLRSTIQYKLKASEYVIELNVYRTWIGHDTRAEPLIETSVTMHHADWEWLMDETTEAREWDEHLTQVFQKTAPDISGIRTFVNEVEEIQVDLSDCCRPFFEKLKEASVDS